MTRPVDGDTATFGDVILTLSVSTNNSKYLDFFRTGSSQIAMIRSTSFYTISETLGLQPLAFQLKLKEMELNRLRPLPSFKGTRGNATTETMGLQPLGLPLSLQEARRDEIAPLINNKREALERKEKAEKKDAFIPRDVFTRKRTPSLWSSRCSIQQYRVSLHNFLKDFPYNRLFFRSLFAPHPETDPRHSAHSLRAREGNEVQFMRPQRSGVEQPRHFLKPKEFVVGRSFHRSFEQLTYESAITQLNPSPQALSVVGCAKQPIPLYDDSVTFDTLHLVARNLDFCPSLVQLD
uniref:Uncharacterized protein n=1 Tax=Solanum lycopersicum TaxID=4081 RepID=A0A3Q7J7D5_SOLLC